MTNQTEQKATPAEQEMYELIVLAGMYKTYSDQTHDVVMRMLKNDKDDPVQALVSVTTMVLPDVSKSNVLAAYYVIPTVLDIAELAKVAGVFQADKSTVEQAIKQAIEKYDSNSTNNQENDNAIFT